MTDDPRSRGLMAGRSSRLCDGARSMIDEALLETACARLSARAAALRSAQYTEPVLRSYTFQEIRDGIGLKELRRDFESGKGARAIYVIAIDPESAQSVLDAFMAAAHNKQRGYCLPRLVSKSPKPTMYVGSSQSIATRLHQHLNRVSGQTYALNMNRWWPSADGVAHVAVQCVSEVVGRDTFQDMEDALWLSREPMFGRLGSR